MSAILAVALPVTPTTLRATPCRNLASVTALAAIVDARLPPGVVTSPLRAGNRAAPRVASLDATPEPSLMRMWFAVPAASLLRAIAALLDTLASVMALLAIVVARPFALVVTSPVKAPRVGVMLVVADTTKVIAAPSLKFGRRTSVALT